MAATCSARPSSSSSGKKNQPWWLMNQTDSGLRALRGLLRREREDLEVDVRVRVDLVRVGVVARVLALPPAVAQADEQVGQHEGRPVVGAPVGEDLAVRGVVSQERDLREDHGGGEGDGDLPPGVAHQDDRGDQAEDGDDGGGEPHGVVRGATLHQAGGLDGAGQLGEVADGAVARSGGCGGKRRGAHGVRPVGRARCGASAVGISGSGGAWSSDATRPRPVVGRGLVLWSYEAQRGVMFDACGPLGPCVTSNWTFWFSSSVR